MRIVNKVVAAMLVVLIIAVGTVSYFATDTATVYSDPINANVGEEVVVPILIKDNPGISAIGLNVTYDKNVLTPVSAEKGAILTSGMTDNSIGVGTNNTFNVLWFDTKNTTANGTLFNIKFNVKDSAPTSTTITLAIDEENTFNSNYNLPDIQTQDVVLNISGGQETTTEAETEQTTTIPVTGTLKFSIDKVKSEKNESVTVPVKVSGNKGLLGFKLIIEYDVDSVAVDSLAASDLISSGQFNYKDNGSGKITVLWNSSTEFAENGTMFNISATALKEGENGLRLNYSYDDTFDAAYNSVDAVCENGHIWVNVFGDVNLDGTCSILDATFIQKYLVELNNPTAEQLAVMDVNNDGRKSIQDATYIQLYLAKLI